MTREFFKWTNKHGVTIADLSKILDEVEAGNFEADLGGHVIKKRVRFQGQGKSGSGRTIICFKKEDRAIHDSWICQKSKGEYKQKRT